MVGREKKEKKGIYGSLGGLCLLTGEKPRNLFAFVLCFRVLRWGGFGVWCIEKSSKDFYISMIYNGTKIENNSKKVLES